MQQEDVFPMFDKIRKKNKFIGYAIYMYWRDREVEKKTISPREAWKCNVPHFRDLMTAD